MFTEHLAMPGTVLGSFYSSSGLTESFIFFNPHFPRRKLNATVTCLRSHCGGWRGPDSAQVKPTPGPGPSLYHACPAHPVVPGPTCKGGLWGRTEEAAAFLAFKFCAVFHLLRAKDISPGDSYWLPSPRPQGTYCICPAEIV